MGNLSDYRIKKYIELSITVSIKNINDTQLSSNIFIKNVKVSKNFSKRKKRRKSGGTIMIEQSFISVVIQSNTHKKVKREQLH